MAFGPTGELPPQPRPDRPQVLQFHETFNPASAANFSQADLALSGSELNERFMSAYQTENNSLLGIPGRLEVVNSAYTLFFSDPVQMGKAQNRVIVGLNTGRTTVESMRETYGPNAAFIEETVASGAIPNVIMIFADDVVPPNALEVSKSGVLNMLKAYTDHKGWYLPLRSRGVVSFLSALVEQGVQLRTTPVKSVEAGFNHIADFTME